MKRDSEKNMSLSGKYPSRDRHRGGDKRGEGRHLPYSVYRFSKVCPCFLSCGQTLGCLIHSYVLSEFSFRNVRTDVTAGKEGGTGDLTTATGVCSNRGSGTVLYQDPHNFLGVGKRLHLGCTWGPLIPSALGVSPAG